MPPDNFAILWRQYKPLQLGQVGIKRTARKESYKKIGHFLHKFYGWLIFWYGVEKTTMLH